MRLIIALYKSTRKRAIAKALQLEGHSDFAPVDLAYYQHFLSVAEAAAAAAAAAVVVVSINQPINQCEVFKVA